MWNRMPISLAIKWRAWWKLNGPPSALRDDYLAADVAMKTAVPYIAESERNVASHLPPWRRPADFRPWVDFGEDTGPATFSVE